MNNDIVIRPFENGDEFEVSELICATLKVSNKNDYSPEFIQENINSHSPDIVAKRAKEDILHMEHVKRWFGNPSDWIAEIKGRYNKYKWIHHYIVELNNEAFAQYPDVKKELWGGEFWSDEFYGAENDNKRIRQERN